MKLKNLLILFILFSFQIYLVFRGAVVFGKILNPFLLLFVSIGLGIYAYQQRNNTELISSKGSEKYSAWLFAGIGLLSVICLFGEIGRAFIKYPAYTNSDVMIQLEAQYNRFVHGEYPYKPIEELAWKPFPVYMPMHWLPIGISKLFHLDTRWSSFFIYAFASGLFGYFAGSKMRLLAHKIIFALLPSIVLWVFVHFGTQDLFVTIEILIAAYYLILATGLLLRNKTIIVIGIILCLLSRYTFIFWLPLFAILFLTNNSIKKSVGFASAILIAVLCIYVIPFLRIDPTIFSKGIRYHNDCAVGEWNDSFYTSTYGVNFAFLIKSIVGDDNGKGVYINRIIQAIALLITMFIGLWFYFKPKMKPNYSHYSMLFLYLFMLVFFCFCPLTYRYYLVTLSALSIAVMALPFIESETTNKLK